MRSQATGEHVERIVRLLEATSLSCSVVENARQKFVEVLDAGANADRTLLNHDPMVDQVLDKAAPNLAAGRQPEGRTIEVPLGGGASIGGRRIGIIAGPCSVESRSQILEIATAVKEAGAVALRGGAFKPRTSPYCFQGLGQEGLELLALAREETRLSIVTEVMQCEHVDMVAPYADVLQVGSRSMHCSPLLKAVGRQDKPVLLKRGWSATLEEFLFAAEYIMVEGNHRVILCERGIRTYESYVRNTLALAVVPELKRISTLPVIVDPSHGTGRSHLVAPMSNAAVACGADGLLVEVHRDPRRALSDGAQSLDLEQFRSLMDSLGPFARACGRTL
jgi:3-deoxy-7-phosphoheptulonate synthase